MISQMLYLAGPPGVGKSTLARELTQAWDKTLMRTHSVPHVRLNHPVSGRLVGLELGVPRPVFPGTDALAMDIGPRALTFLSAAWAPFALGEGSRLATRPFLGGLVASGVRLTFVSLSAPEDLLDERWRARGSKQNTAWRKGAFTRAARMAEWAGATDGVRLLKLEATQPLEDQFASVLHVFPLIDLREPTA
jgi:DNA polymerase III delta prime subunit